MAHIDFGTVLVIVLTTSSAGFLVWLELHSRRNAANQQPSAAPRSLESLGVRPQDRKRSRDG